LKSIIVIHKIIILCGLWIFTMQKHSANGLKVAG
jgi:hypothetical protein